MGNSHFIRVCLCLVFVPSAIVCQAAEIQIFSSESDRSDLGTIISVEGDLLPGDSLRFQNIAKQVGNKGTVLLSSNGGSLISGIEIGREIRRLGYQTAVVDTCASACALGAQWSFQWRGPDTASLIARSDTRPVCVASAKRALQPLPCGRDVRRRDRARNLPN